MWAWWGQLHGDHKACREGGQRGPEHTHLWAGAYVGSSRTSTWKNLGLEMGVVGTAGCTGALSWGVFSLKPPVPAQKCIYVGGLEVLLMEVMVGASPLPAPLVKTLELIASSRGENTSPAVPPCYGHRENRGIAPGVSRTPWPWRQRCAAADKAAKAVQCQQFHTHCDSMLTNNSGNTLRHR